LKIKKKSRTHLRYFKKQPIKLAACLTIERNGTAWIHPRKRQLARKHTVKRLQRNTA